MDKISNGQHRFIIIVSPTVLKKNNPTILQSHNDHLVMGVSLLTITCPLCKQPLSVSPTLTGADISTIVNQAALKAANDEAPFVTMEHLDYAVDKFLMGQCFGSDLFNVNYLSVLVQTFFTYSLLISECITEYNVYLQS